MELILYNLFYYACNSIASIPLAPYFSTHIMCIDPKTQTYTYTYTFTYTFTSLRISLLHLLPHTFFLLHRTLFKLIRVTHTRLLSLTSSIPRDNDVALKVPMMSNTLRQRNSLRTGFSYIVERTGEM